MLRVMRAAEALDHLVLASPDLEQGIKHVDALTGVRAAGGGSHSGLGTRNALVYLGGRAYLEIIAPDPAQAAPERPRPFGIDTLALPRLVGWAIRAEDLDERVERARKAGFDPGPVTAMSRLRPDGVKLAWRLTLRQEPAHDGLAPFLIAWGDTPHPSQDTPRGISLVSLRAESPAPHELRKSLEALGLEMDVREAAASRLLATLQTGRGAVELS